MTGPAERARSRRRTWWLMAIFVLLLLSAPWLLARDARSANVRPVIEPSVRPESLPEISEPARTSPAAEARPARETERTRRDSCGDLKVLVDRTHALPADYTPDGLVSLRDFGIPILGQGAMLRREAAGNLERLVAAAAADGQELTVASAYRSYADQETSYARLVSIYGEGAGKTSATPGHSQHQLGTAVDFTNEAVGYEVHRRFGRTTAYRWLLDHAPEYGFVLAYPRGEEGATGFQWEPWHYRYVGAETAKKVGDTPHGLQGFLSREGVTPRC